MIQSIAGSVEISVKAIPGAKRDAIVGPLGNALKVKVSAPPEDGKANDSIRRLLAEKLGVAMRDVEVTAGHSSPRKRIRIRGVDETDVRQRISC